MNALFKQRCGVLGAGFVFNPTETISMMIATAVYSEGVVSQSPGLPRFAATLGSQSNDVIYPEGVASLPSDDDATPLG